MTTEQLNDQELDTWIAEHVMGWTLDPEGFYLDHANCPTGWGAETREAVTIDVWELFPACRAFTPSSDWGVAGLLMETLKQRGLVVFIKADGLRDGTFSPGYTAIISNMPRTDADTGPRALTLAAKKYYSPYAQI